MRCNFLSQLKLILVFTLMLLNITAFACINDYDAKFFEAQKFPTPSQLLSGEFITHSKDFYLWRAADRLKKIKKEPKNLAYYDDLAVSYEKTGQIEKAIDTLEKIYSQNPDRYETIANLGTFYIHNKQYRKGVDLLKKAVKINPAAHFGREIYQIKVVEYLLKENRDENFTVPIQKSRESFADFILKDAKPTLTVHTNDSIDAKTTELLKASVGIGAMLKFGNSDSPVLLEALGDIYAKLDKLNDRYATSQGVTSFGRFALLYYAAAVSRGKTTEEVAQNKKQLEQKFQFYLAIKGISTQVSFKDEYGYLSELYTKANESNDAYRKKEVELIKKGGNVEQNIYNQLYPPPQSQEDLFETAKKNYFALLEDSIAIHEYDAEKYKERKQSAILTVIALSLIFFGFIFGLYLTVYYCILSVSRNKLANIKLKKAFSVSLKAYFLINVSMLMLISVFY